jgi:hypothetical protein
MAGAHVGRRFTGDADAEHTAPCFRFGCTLPAPSALIDERCRLTPSKNG